MAPLYPKIQANVPPGVEAIYGCTRQKPTYNLYKGSVLVLTFLCYTMYHASRKPPSIVKSVLKGDGTVFQDSSERHLLADQYEVSKTVEVSTELPEAHGWAPFNGPGGQMLLGEVDLAFLSAYAIGMFFAGHLGDRMDLRIFLSVGASVSVLVCLSVLSVCAISMSFAGHLGDQMDLRIFLSVGASVSVLVCLSVLSVCAISMSFAGHLGDQMDLRIFLSVGMVGSGIFCSLFGMGYFWDSHTLSFYIILSVFHGLFQSTGWPSVVSIVANWFGKGKRGLIMGIWNAHTSVGNILGTAIAAAALSSGWGWSFTIPGFLMIGTGILIYLFLVVQPSDVGLPSPYDVPRTGSQELLTKGAVKEESHAESIRFIDAWRIPGVSSFAFCLFFSKLIAYTFLYWLPYYIKSTPIEGQMLSPKEAGDLSILFDVGGVAGGVLAGHLSDKTGASALVATSFTLCCVPCLWLYRTFGHTSFSANIALMMMSGFFVNGPYALITTAVSADLGTHESLQGNSKALATVSAIIDGMGSFGAALGPMATGYISQHGGFDMVFTMLYTSAFLAALLLVKLTIRELQVISEHRK
eukprot:gene225-3993_t